jgi:polyisoprenoid-binding protein YceI
MSRTVKLIIGLIAAVAVVGIIAVVVIFITGGSGEASEPISAPSVEAAEGGVVFSIIPAESEVRFELDEDLRGERITVVGRTDQVAGQLVVNFDAPRESTVGAIRINARTLTTDNEFRNRAIRSQILLSAQNEYEFAEFVPTSIDGLPETVSIGEPITFTVTGDLTLRGITAPVTFDVTVTPVSRDRLEGTAAAVVQRDDFDLQIPSVPGVANVEEEVELYIDFVAAAIADEDEDEAVEA